MIPTFKSEVRKLFTVRSTYAITGIALALVIFLSFYVSGWRADMTALHDPNELTSTAIMAVSTIAVFGALVAVLLFTQEYRYNTIMHTLTLSNSRTKILISKIVLISGFALALTAVVGVLAPVLEHLGIQAHHLTLIHQSIYYRDLIWRCLFFGWGYAMAGLLIAALLRSQVAAIITLFIVPTVVESLIGLILKARVVYLPFNALDTVVGHGDRGGPTSTYITHQHAALVFLAYLIGGWIIAWLLFLRRDAS